MWLRIARKEAGKVARPIKDLDKITFEKLCALQCTKLEICESLNVTDKTLERWCKRTYGAGFSEVFREKRTAGFVSLRAAQFQMAKTNPTMAIFLGKQYLDQHDKTEITTPTPIVIVNDVTK